MYSMKTIFKPNEDTAMVMVSVFRDNDNKPKHQAIALVNKNEALSLSFDVNIFLTSSAVYGDACTYTVAIQPYKGDKDDTVQVVRRQRRK